MKRATVRSIKRIGVTILLSAILVFFIVHHAVVKQPGAIEHFFSYCVYPLFVIQKKIFVPFHNYQKTRQEKVALYEQLLLVQRENEDLKSYITQLEASKEFVQQTDELQKFQKKYDNKTAHLAQIIFKRISEHEHIIMVDVGSKHGITHDMVAVYKSNLLGKVVDVYPYYSTVMLLTDKRCKVSAACVWTKTKGILQGTNHPEKLLLTHVDHLKKLREKEILLSAGEGVIFPQGFNVGTIESFKPEGVHYTVTVTPAFNPYDLDYCFVLQKGAEFVISEKKDEIVNQ